MKFWKSSFSSCLTRRPVGSPPSDEKWAGVEIAKNRRRRSRLLINFLARVLTKLARPGCSAAIDARHRSRTRFSIFHVYEEKSVERKTAASGRNCRRVISFHFLLKKITNRFAIVKDAGWQYCGWEAFRLLFFTLTRVHHDEMLRG